MIRPPRVPRCATHRTATTTRNSSMPCSTTSCDGSKTDSPPAWMNCLIRGRTFASVSSKSCGWLAKWGSAVAGRLVALKVLSASAALSQRRQERFIREAESLGRLRHPNVITVFDVLHSDGVLAYAMEWIDGRSLADLVERLGAASASATSTT